MTANRLINPLGARVPLDDQYAYYRLRADVVQAYVATLEIRLRLTPARGARSAPKGALRR